MPGKNWVAVWIVAVAMMSAGAVRSAAQDVVKVSPEHNKVTFENEHVRVIQKKLAPKEKDPMHNNLSGWYYVTKPGRLMVRFDDGEVQEWVGVEGQSGWMEANAPHTYENVGNTTLEMTIVEVKSTAKPANK